MAYGIIVINKGEGISSQSVVNRVKRLFGEAKAGHTGTLDPLATGVLPVLLGRAVKASEFMLSSDKHYRATLKLGLTTDTDDITGKVLTAFSGSMPSEERVREVIRGFVGVSLQTPPMYSALKVGGKKLCDLARAGQTVERRGREITIHSIGVKRLNDDCYTLDVHCSKGTYIRTLCADIGAALGTGGVMAALLRTHASVFALDDAYTLEQLEAMDEAERIAKIVPLEHIFMHLNEVKLPPFFARLAECGVEIYQRKIGTSYQAGTLIRLKSERGFFALGEVRAFEDGLAIKPIRQFLI